MNNNDILERCLRALEEGRTVDAILRDYPDRARELRPLLETARQARMLGGALVPGHFQSRDRNRLLRRAGELRQGRRLVRLRLFPSFPRLAITLGVVAAMALTSTGLVSASGGALPGDRLYPVKRTWEGVRLLLVFTPPDREILASQYQQERLNEIDSLLTQGRGGTSIAFSGLVTGQNAGVWTVSGIPVFLSSSTILPQGAIMNGAPVQVTGITRSDGRAEAEEIQVLQPGAPLPPFEPSRKEDQANLPSASTPIMPSTAATPIPQFTPPERALSSYEYSGVVESMKGGIWTINGQSVHLDPSQIDSTVQVGSAVKFQGYYDSNGEFVVSNLQLSSHVEPVPTHHGGNNNNNGQGNGGGDGSGSPAQGGGEGGKGGGGNGTPTGGEGEGH